MTAKEGEFIIKSLFENKKIVRSMYPTRAVHPTFSEYKTGDYYKIHEDNPLQAGIRADISYTIMLSTPEDYDGGELSIGEADSAKALRLPLGSIILYDSGTPHEVLPVTKGIRRVAVGWIQSVVRSAQARKTLNLFYNSLESIENRIGVNDPAFISLNRIRIQLMRDWAEI